MVSLALARQFSDDEAGARARFAEALTISQAVGTERLAVEVAMRFAELEFAAGDAMTALRLASEALTVDRALNNVREFATELCNMAAYLIALDRYDEARAHAREASALARDLQLEVLLAVSLQHLAAVAAFRPGREAEHSRGDRKRAVRLLGYVDARLTALEFMREYTEQQEYDKMLPALRDALGEDELSKLTDEGRAWSEDQGVEEAMLI